MTQAPAATVLAAQCSIVVELHRSSGEDWGFDLKDSYLQSVHDGGLLAQWNWKHPSRAAVRGDQVMVNGLSDGKVVQQQLKQSLAIKLTVMRQGTMTSTFGIKLVKTAGRKLGLKLSEDVEIINIDPQGALAFWNASHPLMEVHLGDRIWQVGETVSPEQIFRSLQSATELDFLIGRCPRRLDSATGRVLSSKECEAIYGKDAPVRWSKMQLVPVAPEQTRDIMVERQYLGGAELGGENRTLLASESFYRTRTFSLKQCLKTAERIHATNAGNSVVFLL